MSHHELEKAIKDLTDLLQGFLRQQELLQTTAETDMAIGSKLDPSDNEHTDEEFYDASTIESPISTGFHVPRSKPGDVKKTSKSQYKVKRAGPNPTRSKDGKHLLRNKLKKVKTSVREIENGVRMNLTTIEQHLEKMKTVRDEIASCNELAKMI